MSKKMLTILIILSILSVSAYADEFKGLVPGAAEGIWTAATNLDKGVEGVAWACTHPVEATDGTIKGISIAGKAVIDTTVNLGKGTIDGLYTAATNLDKAAEGVGWACTHPVEATEGMLNGLGKASGWLLKVAFGGK